MQASRSRQKLILDSGAYSVWTKGKSVDLEEYIAFCERHPEVPYYVCLDVIPGQPNSKQAVSSEEIEAAFLAGWNNYQQMIKCLPASKVIPVFHQGDDVSWLRKYLDAGVEYMGISPLSDRTKVRLKLDWLDAIEDLLFDDSLRPLVKTHAFGVSSYNVIKHWKWHSVDSQSWKKAGAEHCSIYLPKTVNGEWDFTKGPTILPISPVSSDFASLGPDTREKLGHWIEECGLALGSYRVERRDGKRYKPQDRTGEAWIDRPRGLLMVPTERGIATHSEERLKMNAEFMKRANVALAEHVDHIYLAGAPMPYPLEFEIENRLLSYIDLRTPAAERRYLGHTNSDEVIPLKTINEG